MSYPNITTKEDYQLYEAAVATFLEDFEGEPSTGYWECPECGSEDYDNCDGCPDPDCYCHGPQEIEPYFSWRWCDCCDRNLGGDREDVIGWLKGARELGYPDSHRWSGSICVDCLYYLAYGRLDDMTMMRIEES